MKRTIGLTSAMLWLMQSVWAVEVAPRVSDREIIEALSELKAALFQKVLRVCLAHVSDPHAQRHHFWKHYTGRHLARTASALSWALHPDLGRSLAATGTTLFLLLFY